jgi:hypothetical protein
VLAPMAARGVEWAQRSAAALAALAAATSVVGLLLKLVPGFTQDNLQVVALALPANLGLAVGLTGLRRPTRG